MLLPRVDLVAAHNLVAVFFVVCTGLISRVFHTFCGSTCHCLMFEEMGVEQPQEYAHYLPFAALDMPAKQFRQ
jgi:hypothetical protein